MRTLIIALTMLGIWLGLHVRSVNRQQDSVEAVTANGGWVYYDYELLDSGLRDPQAESPVPQWLLSLLGPDHFHDVVGVNMMSYQAGNQWMTNSNSSEDVLWHLVGFPQIETLVIDGKQVTDEGLRQVGRLKHLRHLVLYDAPQITDRGISYLSDLEQLHTIQLSDAQLTDEALRTLGGLPRLEALLLQGNGFTDDGLKHFRTLANLRELWLGNGRSITDEGLVHLSALENLEVLELSWTEISDEGLRHLAGLKKLNRLIVSNSHVEDASLLQGTLPKCKIDL